MMRVSRRLQFQWSKWICAGLTCYCLGAVLWVSHAAAESLDTQLAVAAALRNLSVTEQAGKAQSDAYMRKLSKRVERWVETPPKRPADKRKLLAAHNAYIGELARRSPSFDQQTAFFRTKAANEVTTVTGQPLLVAFATGQEQAALTALTAHISEHKSKGMQAGTKAMQQGAATLALEAQRRGLVNDQQLVDALKPVTDNDPCIFAYCWALARAYYRLGQLPPAQDYVTAALKAANGRDQQRQTHILLGRILQDQGNDPAAQAHYEQALALFPKRGATPPTSATEQAQLQHLLGLLGRAQESQGDLQAALASYRQEQAIADHLGQQVAPGATRPLPQRASYNRLGHLYQTLGNLPEATRQFRRHLAHLQQDAKQNSLTPAGLPAAQRKALADAHRNLGEVEMAMGDFQRARFHYQAALRATQTLAAQKPRNPTLHSALALAHSRVGEVQLAQGNALQAQAVFQAARDMFAHLAAVQPANQAIAEHLAAAHVRTGTAQHAQGDLYGAQASFTHALTIRASLLQAAPTQLQREHNLAMAAGKLCEVQADLLALPQALKHCTASHQVLLRHANKEPHNAHWQRDLALSHIRLGNLGGDDNAHLRKALQLAQHMEQTGTLLPRDQPMLEKLQQQLATR